MLPERLGSFEITGLLGEGGSALVYAAREAGREVALKVLHADLCVDDKQIERFVAEAERMRAVHHHALVPVLGAGCLPGGRPYIVMPRLTGRSLAARLADGPLPLSRALALFEDVARAVASLHEAGLVHRDIKPENVFWLESEDRLVLLDLGIARSIEGAPSTTTRAGFQRGTPAYMAPERLFGQGATVASDIYELGLLLVLMLTARLPWEEGDALRRVKPELRVEDRARMPAELAATLLEALSFDLTQRPPTALALLQRVQESAAQPRSFRTPAAFAPTTLHAQHTPALAPQVATNPPLPTAAPARGRGAALALGTFVLGAGLVGGLAFGVPALRARGVVGQAPAARADEPALALPASAEVSAAAVAVEPAPAPAPVPAPASASAEPPASAQLSASASARPSAQPIKEGTLPKGVIEARIRGRMSAMSGCAAGEMKEASLSSAAVAVNFWIGTGGNVTSASGKSKELSRGVVDCVLGQIRGLAFPQPEGGPVNVILPLRFTR